jgi:LacI family transcriptional regulator
MATIREVAKLAGVAPITVSRVINNSGYISPETRERVQAVIEQLGYVPNTLARSLRWHQTGTLALVLTDITNPFWTTVVHGVEDAASQSGYSVILCNTNESNEQENQYVNVMLQRQVDGILLAPVCSGSGEGPVRLIQRQKVPVVVLDRRLSGVSADTVRCDSVQGAYDLTRMLIECGHRSIVLLSGPDNVSTATDRVMGFQRAIEDAGLVFDPEMVRYGQFTVQSGFDLAKQLVAQGSVPDAIFAGNNFLAVGALRALRMSGLRVPEDVSLVGFDDLPADLLIDPFLTVAAQPAYRMGYEATRLLLGRILGPEEGADKAEAEMPSEIILPVDIIQRRSVVER